jgi:DNA-binding transcriptional MocR family regulator
MLDRARLVTGYLAALARAGAPLPTNRQIGIALDLSQAQVSDALAQAQARGLLVLHGRRGGAASWIEAGDASWRLGGPSKLERLCLRCREPFRPPGRYRFCCESCARANAGEAA